MLAGTDCYAWLMTLSTLLHTHCPTHSLSLSRQWYNKDGCHTGTNGTWLPGLSKTGNQNTNEKRDVWNGELKDREHSFAKWLNDNRDGCQIYFRLVLCGFAICVQCLNKNNPHFYLFNVLWPIGCFETKFIEALKQNANANNRVILNCNFFPSIPLLLQVTSLTWWEEVCDKKDFCVNVPKQHHQIWILKRSFIPNCY